MKVLIIEDENRAANRLAQLLMEIDPQLDIIDRIDTVSDSIKFLKSNAVDLIFSDIQLADGISFEIFKTTQIDCPIIFTTAYDQYAINAFNTNGIDYILKPIEHERLAQALAKFKGLQQPTQIDIEKLLSLTKHPQQAFKKRFMIILNSNSFQ